MVGWTILGAGVALVAGASVTEGLIGDRARLAAQHGRADGASDASRSSSSCAALKVGDAMRVDVPFVGPNLTIDTFANRFEGPDAVTAMPVVDDDKSWSACSVASASCGSAAVGSVARGSTR